MKHQQGTAQAVALVAIFVCAFASPALALDCPELLGRLRGPIETVAVSGGYAYVGRSTGLSIVDVSTPSAPLEVGHLDEPWHVLSVAVSGGYAYVTGLDWDSGQSGLHVIDVSTPSVPVEVAFLGLPDVSVGVAVDGDYAYVVTGAILVPSSLRVINVSTPSTPVEVGFFQMPYGAADVAVSGGYAYIADIDGGLLVIDVTTPSAPAEVGFVETTNSSFSVAISGSYAYVVGFGLSVIDVSAPSAPMTVSFLGSVSGNDVAVRGEYAYVALADWWEPDEGGLRVVDVSVPSTPVEIGFIETPGNAVAVAASGDYAYVADQSAGLRVINVSAPASPVEVGFIETPGDACDVAVSGGYAYVAARAGGLRVIDVSTPSAPVVVGFVDTPSEAWGVKVSGGYAYVADFEAGLRVVDVRTPSAPVEVGFVDTPGLAIDVAVSGGYAYVSDGDSGLRVVNVSTPFAPVEVGFIGLSGFAHDVAVAGDYAYVANGEPSLRIIDVSTPSAPVEVGWVDTPGHALGVAVAGTHAFVDGEGQGTPAFGLWVIDVSTPSAPIEEGFVRTPGGDPFAVAVSGEYVYLTTEYGGLRVIDAGTPSAPVEVAVADCPDGNSDVAVADNYVYLAGGNAGLSIFRGCGRVVDARECFIPAAAVAAGAKGAFFSTDVEINNKGTEEAQVSFQWLPRGEDNSEPLQSEPVALAPGKSVRYENVLTELFNLEPDSLGALKLVASAESVIGMSRTYNSSEGQGYGTFGQGLPAVRATEMIAGRVPQRIIFLSEDFVSRANVGCVNGSSEQVTINIELFNSDGEFLEVKSMDLGPYSNDQINRVFGDYQWVNGYVDVWTDDLDALYTCYGSLLDNETSDPTTILPQVPSADMTFIPAAALAAGLEGSFFRTDLDLNNVGSTDLTYQLLWLPRRDDNSEAVHSDLFSLAPGAGVRYGNVLDEVFGLEPDQVGALAVAASGIDLLAMSRTYNLPSATLAGTFGQELPGIPADRMIPGGVKKRIIFMNENDDVRSNVGCQNGSWGTVRVFLELFNSEGESLEVKTMDLLPWSNNQINRVFRDYAPIAAGYVDVWTDTPGATIYCYGSVLDNVTSDPTTIPPM